MKLKSYHQLFFWTFVAIVAFVVYHWYQSQKMPIKTIAPSFGEAPVAATYSNIYYGAFNPNDGSVPPVMPTLFDTQV